MIAGGECRNSVALRKSRRQTYFEAGPRAERMTAETGRDQASVAGLHQADRQSSFSALPKPFEGTAFAPDALHVSLSLSRGKNN
ncbi:hypothetical protein Poly41_54330 [Novipirellula artificiosorum]|uniref:Uncharacterized protein n=1 Tax=Novipirellula artificiosorum TaxID=2528016 RepID=A0A5C6D8K8_9BACT|nr:hypothetical protein Poly41_54330 [Novipirellula artificiosorum]